jgi:hypothetical protein
MIDLFVGGVADVLAFAVGAVRALATGYTVVAFGLLTWLAGLLVVLRQPR